LATPKSKHWKWIEDRHPVTVSADAVAINDTSVPFASRSIADVVSSYVKLVNQVRLRPLHDVLVVRETDVAILAAALDTTPEAVLTQLRATITLSAVPETAVSDPDNSSSS